MYRQGFRCELFGIELQKGVLSLLLFGCYVTVAFIHSLDFVVVSPLYGLLIKELCVSVSLPKPVDLSSLSPPYFLLMKEGFYFRLNLLHLFLMHVLEVGSLKVFVFVANGQDLFGWVGKFCGSSLPQGFKSVGQLNIDVRVVVIVLGICYYFVGFTGLQPDVLKPFRFVSGLPSHALILGLLECDEDKIAI